MPSPGKSSLRSSRRRLPTTGWLHHHGPGEGGGVGTIVRHHRSVDSGVLAGQSPVPLKAVPSLGATGSLPPIDVPLVGQGLVHLDL
jgi:hypothetical protein